jgi:lipopolysaccharide export system permease protein
VFTYQDYSFFVNEASKGVAGNPDALQVRGVMIFEKPTDVEGFPTLYTAKSAIYDKGNWSMKDVVVHTLDNDGFTSLEVRAARMSLPLRAPIPMLTNPSSGFAGQPDNYTMSQLAQQIAVLKRTGQDSTAQEVAFQFKMALPFLCLSFALCAPALSFRFARTGSFMGIFLSIVMVFVAWNTLLLTKALGLSGDIPPILSAWSPDILFAVVGIVLTWGSE